MFAACHGRTQARAAVVAPAGPIDAFTVSVETDAVVRPANRMLLGANVQWVDRGDDLLDAQGRARPNLLRLAQDLHPPMLRYPGGSQTDTYHWRAGVGPLEARGRNEHFNSRVMQPTIMGTREFLEYCEATSSVALISVNVASGTPEEAAAWVALVNREGLISRNTGRRLPAVKYWELGNEPYLQDAAQPGLWIDPTEFGRRAQAFIVAMRGIDPDIAIVLPATNDTRNGIPATPYPGFTRAVLRRIRAKIDYVSLHDAYLPEAMDRAYTRDELYWGAMAASETVRGDLREMRALLRDARPTEHWPIAITEYNALFTLGAGASDDWVASPVAAIYLADLLRVLAQDPDVAFADYWSLSGNWRFGAIRSDGQTRPSYDVLELYSELLHGGIVPAPVEAQTVDTPSVGGSAAVRGLRLVEALATRENATLRMILIHKDYTRMARGTIHLRGLEARSGEIAALDWSDPWSVDRAGGASERRTSRLAGGTDIVVELPPHSVALVTLALKP